MTPPLSPTARIALYHGDLLKVMRRWPAGCVALTVCSPPYEAKRTYGIGFKLKGEAWAKWCADGVEECCRVTNGPVCWVVGHGESGAVKPWSAAPALLEAELHRRGVHLLRTLYYRRYGVPGSGGRQWFAATVERIVCATGCPGGVLPFAKVAEELGEPPKFAPGGEPSHRLPNGRRCNLIHTKTMRDGSKRRQGYVAPKKANPGDVLEIAVGGGNIGSALAHENEAPFPEKIPHRLIRAFTRPGDVVLDCFGGSGTTLAAAVKLGRRAVCIDVRASQIELMKRRYVEAAAIADARAVAVKLAQPGRLKPCPTCRGLGAVPCPRTYGRRGTANATKFQASTGKPIPCPECKGRRVVMG